MTTFAFSFQRIFTTCLYLPLNIISKLNSRQAWRMKTKRCLKWFHTYFCTRQLGLHRPFLCLFCRTRTCNSPAPTGAWASPLLIPFFCLFCRTRTCNSPAPKGLGLPCPGPTTDLTTCESNSSASGKICTLVVPCKVPVFHRKQILNYHFFCSLKRQCQETVSHLIIFWVALISTQVFEFEYLPTFTRICSEKIFFSSLFVQQWNVPAKSILYPYFMSHQFFCSYCLKCMKQ